MPYTITIRRIIVNDAASPIEANDIVETYGLIEACSDFAIVNENVNVKIIGKAKYNKR